MEESIPVKGFHRLTVLKNSKMCIEHEINIHDLVTKQGELSKRQDEFSKQFDNVIKSLNKIYLLGWLSFLALLGLLVEIAAGGVHL